MKKQQRYLGIAIIAAASCWPGSGYAWESDVHFGLTKWLALHAGFTAEQADTIALGNQRSDAGIMDSIALTLEYACLGRDADGATVAAQYHYASGARLPAPPAQRAIVAGGAAARRPVEKVLAAATPGKAGFMLLKLGESLHVLQDSWAYRGMPQTPDLARYGIVCSPDLAWGNGSGHHRDLTHYQAKAVRALAAATYDVLTRYAPIDGRKRIAASFVQVEQQLAAFIAATTKVDKHAWFRAHGVTDTAFLEMVSLPDGGIPFEQRWPGRRLAALPAGPSRQYAVPDDAKQFFDGFFAAWLVPQRTLAVGDRHLAARLKLWRLRDHGSAAALAHATAPFTPRQWQAIATLTAARGAYAHYDKVEEAFFPLMEQGPVASPLLPFVLHVLPGNAGKRVIAVAKLQHAPYDEVGIIAQRTGGAWRAVDLVALAGH